MPQDSDGDTVVRESGARIAHIHSTALRRDEALLAVNREEPVAMTLRPQPPPSAFPIVDRTHRSCDLGPGPKGVHSL